MKKHLKSLTPIEIITMIAVIIFIGGIAYFITHGYNDYNHINYKYEALTDTTTWEDEDGNKFMKSPDGSVRQIK